MAGSLLPLLICSALVGHLAASSSPGDGYDCIKEIAEIREIREIRESYENYQRSVLVALKQIFEDEQASSRRRKPENQGLKRKLEETVAKLKETEEKLADTEAKLAEAEQKYKVLAKVPTTSKPVAASGGNISFQHHASVQRTESKNSNICGATVVNSLLLVTVAHCVSRVSVGQLRAVTGRRNLTTSEGTEQVRNIRQIILHNQHNSRTFDNDIALLVLDRPLQFDDYTGPIEILGGNAGQRQCAFITGWGPRPGETKKYETIQQVPANLVDQQDCRVKLSKINVTVTDNKLCANPTARYCPLSGDPLVCERASTAEPYLCGITSRDFPCNQRRLRPNLPEVFTDVSKYHGWIRDHMQRYQG